MLDGIELPSHPNLLVGLESLDDAGVFRLTDEIALVQTVDFFTPIVDDPYTFGQIAAANALSDVYAMGGTPLTAMNLVCFPSKAMDFSILKEILRGGLDKINEAEVTLVGGHSIDDPELKYGLSVTGTVHPNKILGNAGARPGDQLVLTKPIGTGLVNTALKGNMASAEAVDAAVAQMTTLNREAAELLMEFDVHACTDVTGFGLLGHACEMLLSGEVGIEIDHTAVPIIAGAIEYASQGLIPGGTYRNRDHGASRVEIASGLPDWVESVLFDPQTSGGLIIALPSADAKSLLQKLRDAGIEKASIIGRATSDRKGKVVVR